MFTKQLLEEIKRVTGTAPVGTSSTASVGCRAPKPMPRYTFRAVCVVQSINESELAAERNTHGRLGEEPSFLRVAQDLVSFADRLERLGITASEVYTAL